MQKAGKNYVLWHGTSSGQLGPTYKELREKGGLVKAFSKSPYQEPGVYLSQSREFCESRALGQVKGGYLKGRPLLIEVHVSADEIANGKWDFDYEFMFDAVCRFVKKFEKETGNLNLPKHFFSSEHYIPLEDRLHYMGMLEETCWELRCVYPEKYKRLFRETIESLALQNRLRGIKYIGEDRLPVKSITEFMQP